MHLKLSSAKVAAILSTDSISWIIFQNPKKNAMYALYCSIIYIEQFDIGHITS